MPDGRRQFQDARVAVKQICNFIFSASNLLRRSPRQNKRPLRPVINSWSDHLSIHVQLETNNKSLWHRSLFLGMAPKITQTFRYSWHLRFLLQLELCILMGKLPYWSQRTWLAATQVTNALRLQFAWCHISYFLWVIRLIKVVLIDSTYQFSFSFFISTMEFPLNLWLADPQRASEITNELRDRKLVVGGERAESWDGERRLFSLSLQTFSSLCLFFCRFFEDSQPENTAEEIITQKEPVKLINFPFTSGTFMLHFQVFFFW